MNKVAACGVRSRLHKPSTWPIKYPFYWATNSHCVFRRSAFAPSAIGHSLVGHSIPSMPRFRMLEILFNEPIRWRNRTIERQRQLAATDRNDESVTACVCAMAAQSSPQELEPNQLNRKVPARIDFVFIVVKKCRYIVNDPAPMYLRFVTRLCIA